MFLCIFQSAGEYRAEKAKDTMNTLISERINECDSLDNSSNNCLLFFFLQRLMSFLCHNLFEIHKDERIRKKKSKNKLSEKS